MNGSSYQMGPSMDHVGTSVLPATSAVVTLLHLRRDQKKRRRLAVVYKRILYKPEALLGSGSDLGINLLQIPQGDPWHGAHIVVGNWLQLVERGHCHI